MAQRTIFSTWAVETLPSKRPIDYVASRPTEPRRANRDDYRPSVSAYRQPQASVNGRILHP